MKVSSSSKCTPKQKKKIVKLYARIFRVTATTSYADFFLEGL
jgi:hypothetical protein